GLQVEALVDLTVAVVVDSVADFGLRRDGALILAAVGGIAVQVDIARIAGAHRAGAAYAEGGRVHEAAARAAAAAMVRVGVLLEALVDLAVTVVVDAVAVLGPGEVTEVLAAVGEIAVDVVEVRRAGGDAAPPAYAARDGVRDDARAATAAVQRIGL